MSTIIQIGNVSYVIHRVFHGAQTVTTLLGNRILHDGSLMTPLTRETAVHYTAVVSNVASQKEV